LGPRAAWRLEYLGFAQVFDYTAGKADWLAAGLPGAGQFATTPHIGDLARWDVPTCSLADRIGDANERARASGWETCVVVNAERVVLGLLGKRALDADPATPVEQIMDPSPSTFRPNVSLEEMAHYVREHDLTRVWITTWEGTLVGLLERATPEYHLTVGKVAPR